MIEKRTFELTDVEFRAKTEDEADTKLVRGHAIVFNSDSVDLGGFIERVSPKALDRSLKEAAEGKRNVYALWSHDTALPIGSTRSGTLSVEADAKGLYFEMDPRRLNEMQRDALAAGDMQMSFGFSVRKDSWEEREDGTYLRTLEDIDLFEISPVVSPAYPATDAAMRSLEAWKTERAVEASRKLQADIYASAGDRNVVSRLTTLTSTVSSNSIQNLSARIGDYVHAPDTVLASEIKQEVAAAQEANLEQVRKIVAQEAKPKINAAMIRYCDHLIARLSK